MSESVTAGEQSTDTTTEPMIDVVEVELTVDDQFYYVSRESGDTFKTLPYLMHTALYYAFGMLPSQFRSMTNTPQYEEHYKNAGMAQDIYIHPAIPLTNADSTTRRFACKGDQYRVDNEPDNKNLKETGFQEYLNPGTTFRTFIQIDQAGETDVQDVIEKIPSVVRTGKKMTSTRVEMHRHTATVQSGEFSLDQPIAVPDFDKGDYSNFKNIEKTQLNVDLLQQAVMTGEYVTIEPVRTPVEGMEETVALPVNTSFLGY